MATQTEFCLLGPLMVRSGTAVVPVPRGKQRAVLAALLLSAGRVVSLDELAQALWGDRPPPSARVAVQNHVMRLRRSLGDAGSRIRTHPPGYLILAEADEVDVTRFGKHTDAARAAARDRAWDIAAAQARAGLALWRGEPLADVDSEALALREAPRLAEMRLQALETRIEADLHLGLHAGAIAELRQLTAAYPLRERLHGLLMLALYQDGRQGEALVAYQHVRVLLAEELGADPGAELRNVHQQILTDARLPAAPDSTVTALRSVVPRELPGAVRDFTGRELELATLTGLIGHTGDKPPGAVVISAIGGTAGVGKTTLAVHWAHQICDRFPDGQLYVNLRGYDPAQPMPSAAALAGFLRALGMPGQDIPSDEAERAARYRSLLAGRHMLVVLDNARSAEHVRPLLPGTPTCVTIVTSRDSLAGLIARDGAVRLDLDVLPPTEAIGMLRALIGSRVDAEPDAAAVLSRQCSRLPLALRIAAELAVAHPGTSLTDLAHELLDQQRRLDLLAAGADPRTAVRAVFSWSCQHLDPGAARAFRLLGLHPGPDFGDYVAAALTGTTLYGASQVLELLTRANLIQAARSGRYAMHDLLRAYARELAASNDDDDERRAALTRVFDHYLHTAATAIDALYPSESSRRPRIRAPASPIPPASDHAGAVAWLEAERANLVAVAGYAAGHGWPGHATRLSFTLTRYMVESGHCPEAILIHGHSLAAARDSGDKAAEARAVNSLGIVDASQGRYRRAIAYFDQALVLFRETANQGGEARVLNNLGSVHMALDNYPQAALCLRQALVLLSETGDTQAVALSNLGVAEQRQGHLREAARYYHQAMVHCCETGDRSCLAETLIRFGVLNLEQEKYEQAASRMRGGLSVYRSIGGRSGEAGALLHLGELELRQGRYPQAVDQLRQALTIFRGIGDKPGEVRVLNRLGEAALSGEGLASACRFYLTALEMASQIGMKYEQARAHNGLARVYHTTGDPRRARGHWQEALAIYTDIGAPEAGQLRADEIVN